jgi:hypothetical protein
MYMFIIVKLKKKDCIVLLIVISIAKDFKLARYSSSIYNMDKWYWVLNTRCVYFLNHLNSHSIFLRYFQQQTIRVICISYIKKQDLYFIFY